jgi:hypothetical protein
MCKFNTSTCEPEYRRTPGAALRTKIRTVLATRRLRRIAVIGALVLVSFVAACGGGATAGAQRSVTASDLQRKEYFYQADYLGRRMTFSAIISDVLAPRVFELSGGDVGDMQLLVVTDQPVNVSEGQPVRVTGTAGQLHTSFPSDHAPYEQEDLYTGYDTKPYLYHATIER